MLSKSITYNIKTLKESSLLWPLTALSGLITGGLILSSYKKERRLYRLSNTKSKDFTYEKYMKKSFERLGLTLTGINWEKICENNKKIEEMFHHHSIIISKITALKRKITNPDSSESEISKKEEEFLKQNKSADGIFYNLLYKYSVFMLKDKRSVIVS